jgi:NTP pyrophosphatase (non-canonical NTP hydrolase)
MNFNDYQNQARSTAMYPNIGDNYVYPVLGLSGESGEVAEKFKKIIRDKNGVVSEQDKVEIVKEMGDVLWYLANLSCELNVDLSLVAEKNLEKLFSRKERGVITGSGDNR